MADPTPPQPPPAAPTAAAAAPSPAAKASKPPPPRNQALRMLGLPALPRKLPSRNWTIFWTLTTTITAAIVYDRREKTRATARWAHTVEHLSKEPLGGNGLAQPRKLTIYLSSPPGDGLRVAQDHYTEYVKPILAASGLDWEFVQGRREGDVRAVVAERVRKARRTSETSEDDAANPDREPTKDEFIEQYRKAQGIQEYDGVRGDVVIGRHTWKEYIRGLHEGWLGPLTAPPEPTTASSASESLPAVDAQLSPEDGSAPQDTPAEDKPAVAAEGEKNPEEETPKPKRPLQPKPYNTPADYPSSSLPPTIPAELGPVAPICEPHILGFLNTPLRLYRFFNRRALADDIGREVAAVCLCTYREFRQSPYPELDSSDRLEYEQVRELAGEEKDWLKSVWKEDKPPKEGDEPSETTEKVWSKPIVLDPRIATHMRRFEILPEDEARARQIVVPEEEVEGWTKGKLRQVWRWGRGQFVKKPLVPSEDKDVD